MKPSHPTRHTFIILQLLGDDTSEDLLQPIHCNADYRQNDDDHFVNIPGTLEVCHSLFADLLPFLQTSHDPLINSLDKTITQVTHKGKPC